jgi:ATP-dependent DNA helicase RecQ
MSGKPVAEQEIGFALLQEVVAYPKLQCQEKIFHYYFGENLTVKQVKVLIWTIT